MSTKRKTKDDYKSLAKEKGIKWLGKSLPKNTRIKTKWLCPKCEKIWVTTYASIARGSESCRNCSFSRIGIDNYKILAKEKGIKWLGKGLPKNRFAKTKWQCKNGHVSHKSYHTILLYSGCIKCSRYQISDYQNMRIKNGYEWIGKSLPKDSTINTIWQCENGHVRETSYQNIVSSKSCKLCDKYDIDLDSYKTVGLDRGISWIANDLPKRKMDLTNWQCKNGHVYRMRYRDVYKGQNCPVCSGKKRKDENDYHELAKEKSIKWVGKSLPKNVMTKTKWQCENGHLWEARYGNIRHNDSNCPACKSSKGERKIAQTLEKYGLSYTQEKGFPNLRATNPLKFDFYFELVGHEFLIEYQGMQHYHALRNNFFGGKAALAKRKARDTMKRIFASKRPNCTLIEIPYTRYDDIEKIILSYIGPKLARQKRLF